LSLISLPHFNEPVTMKEWNADALKAGKLVVSSFAFLVEAVWQLLKKDDFVEGDLRVQEFIF
jgi:hypothetical protein